MKSQNNPHHWSYFPRVFQHTEHQLTLLLSFIKFCIINLARSVIIVAIIWLDGHPYTHLYSFLSTMCFWWALLIALQYGMRYFTSLLVCTTLKFFLLLRWHLLLPDHRSEIRPLRGHLQLPKMTVVMKKRICLQLVWETWSTGLIVAIVATCKWHLCSGYLSVPPRCLFYKVPKLWWIPHRSKLLSMRHWHWSSMC